jgi:hypothetical protein
MTDKHRVGIIKILERAREYNPEIGEYKKHILNPLDPTTYSVDVTNGYIILSMEKADDQDKFPSNVSEADIQKIAKSFINNNPAKEQEATNNNTPKKKASLWQRILMVLGFR